MNLALESLYSTVTASSLAHQYLIVFPRANWLSSDSCCRIPRASRLRSFFLSTTVRQLSPSAVSSVRSQSWKSTGKSSCTVCALLSCLRTWWACFLRARDQPVSISHGHSQFGLSQLRRNKAPEPILELWQVLMVLVLISVLCVPNSHQPCCRNSENTFWKHLWKCDTKSVEDCGQSPSVRTHTLYDSPF